VIRHRFFSGDLKLWLHESQLDHGRAKMHNSSLHADGPDYS
jgi:hypothetical protein